MHEYSIVQALLRRVDEEVRRAGAHGVHAVHVSIGELAGVEIDLLRTAYETIRRGSECAEAPLEITVTEAKWQCPRCGGAIARGSALQCRQCGAAARLVSGDEILLNRLDLEVV